MNLHVFNPEHDIALAHDDCHFTAPFAGRQLRADCGFLPALWASDGDFVLVDNKYTATSVLAALDIPVADVRFVDKDDLCHIGDNLHIEPWGWDSALTYQLRKSGVSAECLPTDEHLKDIRQLSNRKLSSRLLRLLKNRLGKNGVGAVGKSEFGRNMDEVLDALDSQPDSVLKAPWSSSGRGVRYTHGSPSKQLLNWARKIIENQGSIMIEPRYDKVMDFGMEFNAEENRVTYRGLSLFNTVNGAYVGNLLASESRKLEIMDGIVGHQALHCLKNEIEVILTEELKGRYRGPLGVDMMVVNNNDDKVCSSQHYLIHPMVEVNLRRTMGHVAIDLARRMAWHEGSMRIVFEGGHYCLRIV